MAEARHRQEQQRPSGRRTRRLVLPLLAAGALTASVVGVAVARDTPTSTASRVSAPAAASKPLSVTYRPGESPYLDRRDRTFSRSAKRVTLKRLPAVEGRKYRTANLNVWPSPQEKGRALRVLPEGGWVAVTGARRAGFAQVVLDRQVRWVNARYLAAKKPVAPRPDETAASTGSTGSSGTASTTSAGLSSAACPDGSGTESGLTSSAVRLFRSACNAFPALSSYGGYDGHGEHSSGKAIDFMVTDPGLGQALADWARAHASELDLYDVIWSQHIWTPVRSAEGWRSMPDRGSSTANHYDHVHISVN